MGPTLCDTVGFASALGGATVVVVSYSGKEINAKLVYYGAGLCGKTTNLEAIFEAVPETSRGKMVSMKTQSDRTLFFDLLPLDLGEIMGFKTRFLLYTVPGQVFYNATRKLVLKGADALVFVADSAVGQMDENLESLANLRQNLTDYGLNLDEIPWVLQYNKRDLPNVYSVDELNASLNPGGRVPVFESVASQGTGVFETFRGISHLLMQKVTRELHRSPQGASAARAARAATDAPPRAAEPAPPALAIVPPMAAEVEPAAYATSIEGQHVVDFSQAAATPPPALDEPVTALDPAPAPDGFERIGTPSVAETSTRDAMRLDREQPSLAFGIDRGTPQPSGAVAAGREPLEAAAAVTANSSEAAMFSDEPAGMSRGATPAAPARSNGGSAKFEERTLALGEAAASSTAIATEAPAVAQRHEVSIPLTIPAGETREIILRITIRPVA